MKRDISHMPDEWQAAYREGAKDFGEGFHNEAAAFRIAELTAALREAASEDRVPIDEMTLICVREVLRFKMNHAALALLAGKEKKECP